MHLIYLTAGIPAAKATSSAPPIAPSASSADHMDLTVSHHQSPPPSLEDSSAASHGADIEDLSVAFLILKL